MLTLLKKKIALKDKSLTKKRRFYQYRNYLFEGKVIIDGDFDSNIILYFLVITDGIAAGSGDIGSSITSSN